MGFGDAFADAWSGAIQPPSAPTNFALFYEVCPNDWYQTYPFYFEIMDKANTQAVATFFLPVPPQQMSVQFLSTAEAYASLGGVVSEVSAPVFYMINMSGTTGMSLNAIGVSNPGSSVNQRKTFDELSGGSSYAAKLARSLARNAENLVGGFVTPEETVPFFKYGSAVNTLKEGSTDDVVTDFESLKPAGSVESGLMSKIGAAVGKMLSGAAMAFTGNISDSKEAGLYLNGFTWDHALRQFFLIYQRERGEGSIGDLYFTDMKNGCRYACVPKNLQFTKSAQSPYITNYQIQLKCWSTAPKGNLDVNSDTGITAVNRFEGDLAEVYTVSAASVITSFQKTRVKLARAKDIGGAMARDAGGSTF